jgi:hypothetical protein
MESDSSAPLSGLLHLSERARQAATASELAFVMVNETFGLVRYRQAVLWAGGRVEAVSGVPRVEADAPFVQWLARVLRPLAHEPAPLAFGAERCADDADGAGDWAEWLPAHALWLPLPPRPDQAPTAGLLLAREDAWSDGEIALLAYLAGTYAHAWAALHRPRQLDLLRARLTALPRRRRVQAAAVAALLLLAPVRLTVLAPGEVVPVDPALVRAPVDGVVEHIHVEPNQAVVEGQALFDLDDSQVASRLEVARKELSTAQAEYNQDVQQAVWDVRAKAQLAIVSGRIDESKAEVDYLVGLLGRIHVKAPRAGVAVFDDPSAWLGRPVAVGEKVMEIAGERDTEIEAWLGVGDAIRLEPGAPATLFLNIDPLAPVRAQLRYAAYEAVQRPDGAMAYRLRAAIAAGAPHPRIGLKGTVRLDGQRVPLVYWLLRKPLSAARQWLGV